MLGSTFHTSWMSFYITSDIHATLVAMLIILDRVSWFQVQFGSLKDHFGVPWTILGSLLGTIGIIWLHFRTPWTILGSLFGTLWLGAFTSLFGASIFSPHPPMAWIRHVLQPYIRLTAFPSRSTIEAMGAIEVLVTALLVILIAMLAFLIKLFMKSDALPTMVEMAKCAEVRSIATQSQVFPLGGGQLNHNRFSCLFSVRYFFQHVFDWIYRRSRKVAPTKQQHLLLFYWAAATIFL